VHHVNDGKFGSRWIAGTPAELTIEFRHAETIDHVVFSHDRTANSDKPISGQGPCVAEYEVRVSEDGKQWRKVADSFDRAPFNDALKRERLLRTAPKEERVRLAELKQQIAQTNAKLAQVPPLPLAWIGKFSQPTAHTVIFKGGDPQKPGEEVKPASLAVLDQVTKSYELSLDASEADRRLALARWIVRPDNPLTPRVPHPARAGQSSLALPFRHGTGGHTQRFRIPRQPAFASRTPRLAGDAAAGKWLAPQGAAARDLPFADLPPIRGFAN
jgi:hypothetical protein